VIVEPGYWESELRPSAFVPTGEDSTTFDHAMTGSRKWPRGTAARQKLRAERLAVDL